MVLHTSFRGRIWILLAASLAVSVVTLGSLATLIAVGPDFTWHGFLSEDEYAPDCALSLWSSMGSLGAASKRWGSWRPRPDLTYEAVARLIYSLPPWRFEEILPRSAVWRTLGFHAYLARSEQHRSIDTDQRVLFGIDPNDKIEAVSRDYVVLHLSIEPRFLYLSSALLALPLLVLAHGPLRRHNRRHRGLCIKCGYDLTGNVSGACPECGEVTPAVLIRLK